MDYGFARRSTAATAVCSGEDLDEIEILDLLASLTDKSLVVADTSGEHERYHLLESTRAYALEKLTAAGAHEQLARRHAQYFRDQAQQADERFMAGWASPAWLASMELELDNYRAVLEWAFKDGHDLVLGGAVAGALRALWSSGGLAVEARYWIGLAQAGLDESAHPQVAARMWRVLGALSSGKRKHDAAQRALAAMRALANKPGVASCLNQQAVIQWTRGDVAAARESFAQALAAYKALGDEDRAAMLLTNLAELEFGEGQVEEALRLAAEDLEITARGKNASSLAGSYVNIAAYRIAADLDGAREAARGCNRAISDIGGRGGRVGGASVRNRATRCRGGIAQLVEHYAGSVGVRSSSLLASTMKLYRCHEMTIIPSPRCLTARM